MATKAKRSQVELYNRIQHLKAEGASTTEAIGQVSRDVAMRPGNVAAGYYREARHRSNNPTTKEVTMTPAATAAEPTTDAPPEEEPKRIGQLAFDGFAVSAHKLKIAGTTLDISDDVAKKLKLGSEISYMFTARVVKRNNHLLTDDDGSTVEHDIVAIMQDVQRV